MMYDLRDIPQRDEPTVPDRHALEDASEVLRGQLVDFGHTSKCAALQVYAGRPCVCTRPVRPVVERRSPVEPVAPAGSDASRERDVTVSDVWAVFFACLATAIAAAVARGCM